MTLLYIIMNLTHHKPKYMDISLNKMLMISPDLAIMAIRVVEFSNGGYKIRKIFAKQSTYSKEIIEFWELN